MSARLRFSGAGLPSARTADASSTGEEEIGLWYYLVTDSGGIRPRDEPSYSKDSKKVEGRKRYTEGEVVAVDRRRKHAWTRWLGTKDAHGWLFDISPKKDKKVRMIEVEVMEGDWTYEAVNESVFTFPKPSMVFAKQQKGARLQLNEVIQVNQRVRPLNGKGSFLKLADGRGWVIDFLEGRQNMRRTNSSGIPSGCQTPQTHEAPTPVPVTGASDGALTSDMTRSGLSGALTGDMTMKSGLSGMSGVLNLPVSAFADENDSHASMQPEIGEWTYMVVDPKGVCPRNQPVYDKGAKINRSIEEGEVVRVTERRPDEGTTFLKICSPAGWVFDCQPGHKSRVRMMEVHVEHGSFLYVVTAEKGVALRMRCSFSDSSKVGRGPEKGALCEIKERVRCGETTFLRLANGSGWVFDKKNGRSMLEPLAPSDYTAMTADGFLGNMCHLHGGTSDGIHLRSAPTSERWAQTKMLVLKDQRLHVSMKVRIHGFEWLRVSKPGGMEGWVPGDCVTMETKTGGYGDDFAAKTDFAAKGGYTPPPAITPPANLSRAGTGNLDYSCNPQAC